MDGKIHKSESKKIIFSYIQFYLHRLYVEYNVTEFYVTEFVAIVLTKTQKVKL